MWHSELVQLWVSLVEKLVNMCGLYISGRVVFIKWQRKMNHFQTFGKKKFIKSSVIENSPVLLQTPGLSKIQSWQWLLFLKYLRKNYMGRAYTCCSTRKLKPKEMSLGKDTANKTTDDRLCENWWNNNTWRHVAPRMMKRCRKNKIQTDTNYNLLWLNSTLTRHKRKKKIQNPEEHEVGHQLNYMYELRSGRELPEIKGK